MNDEQRRIIDDARATVERVSRLSDRNDTPREDAGPNALDRWRDGVRAREAEFTKAREQRQAATDAEARDATAWRDWVTAEIHRAIFQATGCVGDVITERLNEIGDALRQRDARINRLEAELAKLAVEHSKLEVKLLQALVDGDRAKVIDLPMPPLRGRGLN
jgi:hypothetical protein